MSCPHLNFSAEVDVHRLCEGEGGPVTGFMADLRVACAECGCRMQFLGLPAGMNTRGAAVSIDHLEAHLALCPEGEEVSTLGEIAFSFAPSKMN